MEIFHIIRSAISRNNLPEQLNHILPAYCRETVHRVNLKKMNDSFGLDDKTPAQRPSAPPVCYTVPVPSVCPTISASQKSQAQMKSMPALHTLRPITIPNLESRAGKGQKTALSLQPGKHRLRVCFGWNVRDARCDVDASAFLLTGTGRVPDDEWFIFYGNLHSPDHSVCIVNNCPSDRQVIDVDLDHLSGVIQKIAFVLTINEAFENNLHFGMLTDVYIRIMEYGSDREIVSFKPEELFTSITSMTIGELYLHNGQWKFNPVGNGVNKDLAGQCAVYGVEIG